MRHRVRTLFSSLRGSRASGVFQRFSQFRRSAPVEEPGYGIPAALIVSPAPAVAGGGDAPAFEPATLGGTSKEKTEKKPFGRRLLGLPEVVATAAAGEKNSEGERPLPRIVGRLGLLAAGAAAVSLVGMSAYYVSSDFWFGSSMPGLGKAFKGGVATAVQNLKEVAGYATHAAASHWLNNIVGFYLATKIVGRFRHFSRLRSGIRNKIAELDAEIAELDVQIRDLDPLTHADEIHSYNQRKAVSLQARGQLESALEIGPLDRVKFFLPFAIKKAVYAWALLDIPQLVNAALGKSPLGENIYATPMVEINRSAVFMLWQELPGMVMAAMVGLAVYLNGIRLRHKEKQQQLAQQR